MAVLLALGVCFDMEVLAGGGTEVCFEDADYTTILTRLVGERWRAERKVSHTVILSTIFSTSIIQTSIFSSATVIFQKIAIARYKRHLEDQVMAQGNIAREVRLPWDVFQDFLTLVSSSATFLPLQPDI
jgi:DNA repair protein RadC